MNDKKKPTKVTDNNRKPNIAKLITCLLPSSLVSKILPLPYIETFYEKFMECVEEENHAYEEVKRKDK